MRVRMKTRAAAPGQDAVYQPGQVVDVDDETAVAWLNGGYAEAVKRGVERAVTGLGAEPATAIDGIGPATAMRLEGAGVGTRVHDLAGLEPAALAEAAGVNEDRAAGWIDEARMLCEED